MILVTVGTHPQGFDRLVQAMDELAEQLDELVVIQFGSSAYRLRYAQGFAFETSQRMHELTNEARLVVTHAAAGAIILCMHARKTFVVVPRLKQFCEIIDDHQIQLASALEAQGRTKVVMDPTMKTLRAALDHAGELPYFIDHSQSLILALEKQLADWSSKSSR